MFQTSADPALRAECDQTLIIAQLARLRTEYEPNPNTRRSETSLRVVLCHIALLNMYQQ
jgi:hypothetical protein